MRKIIDRSVPLFRGVKLSQSEIERHKNIYINNKKLILDGFTSTSLSKDVAFRFMIRCLQDN